MAVMLRHAQAELGHGVAAVGQQALAERRIGPGPGDDAGAVLRDPLLLGSMGELVDELGRLQAALVESGLDGVGALFDGRDIGMEMGLVGQGGCSQQLDFAGL